jgi:hypothetical protein
MKTANFKIAYCSKKCFEQFKKQKISIGELLMDADEKLRGGLDHYTTTKKQVKIFDIGNNGIANDLIVRPGNF